MAKGICVFFISLLLLPGARSGAQDTITFPLHLRAGFDLIGPLTRAINKDLISTGVIGSLDLNENISVVTGASYSSFSTIEEDKYVFKSRGISLELGVDYNFLKPKQASGKYFAGIGMRYGLSFYGQEATGITYTNPWGTGTSDIPLSHHTGHFFVLTPGVRTELFQGVTIGWNLYFKILLSSGAGKDLKPVYMPGYGGAASGYATGAGYFVSISIPYKKIRVFIKPKPEPTEEEGEGEEGSGTTESITTSGSRGRL